ncbi:MAG: hypothetical protein WBN65_05860 [Gammaproteobacteria bacterium]
MVNAAAANNKPKLIPFQFVYSQLMVVRTIRSTTGWAAVTGKTISKAMELKFVRSPICAFSLSAGTRDWDQKTAAMVAAKRIAMTSRLFLMNGGRFAGLA